MATANVIELPADTRDVNQPRDVTPSPAEESLTSANTETFSGVIRKDAVASLAHELRSPLNTIRGWAQLLPRDHDPRQARALQAIERSVLTLAATIDEMVAASGLLFGEVAVKLRRATLDPLVTEAIRRAGSVATARGVQLASQRQQHVALVRLDAPFLTAALTVLMVTAVRHATPGSTVVVAGEAGSCVIDFEGALGATTFDVLASALGLMAEGSSAQPRADAWPRALLQKVQAVVSGHQGGLRMNRHEGEGGSPPRIAIELVLPPPQAKTRTARQGETRVEHAEAKPAEGSKSSISSHDGVVVVRDAAVDFPIDPIADVSPPGRTLDALASHDLPPAGSVTATLASVDLRHLRVAVVDDDADNLELLRTVLEHNGASVSSFTSADAALANLADGATVDLLISDLSMPGSDGFALLRRLRGREKRRRLGALPAIAFSSLNDRYDRVRARVAGFNAHFCKPLDIAGVLSAAEQVNHAHDRRDAVRRLSAKTEVAMTSTVTVAGVAAADESFKQALPAASTQSARFR